MRTRFVLLLALIALTVNAQLDVKDVSSNQIPTEMKIKGNVISAISYKDAYGLNYIIQTETALLTPKSAVEAAKKYELINVNGRVDTIRDVVSDYRIKGLFVYHYTQNNDSINLLWKNLDNVTDCSYKYLKGEYLTKPLVTDLDNNGVAEVWLVYQLGCRDTATVPLGMKLVLYQDKNAYVIRGMRQTLHASEKEIQELESAVKADAGFNNLHPDIKNYARELWNKYKKEQ